MFVAVFLIPFTLVVIIVGWFFQQKWHFRSLRNVPGAPMYPLIGSALEFGLNPVEKLKDLTRLMDTYGMVNKMSIGPSNYYLLIADPELTEFFMSSPKYLTKSSDYNLLRPWIGNGLLTSTGSYWQKRRKVITPTFHFKILDQFIPIFNSDADILIKKLNKEVGKDMFDIYPYITAYTLDTICETAMGTSVRAQEDEDNEYVKAVKRVSTIFINRTFSAWKQFDCLFKFASEYNEYEKCLNIIHGFTRSVIQKRREQIVKTSATNTEKHDDDFGMKKKQAFLDLLLNSTIDGKPLTDDDITEEVDTFMFEGHDTTASAICFALYELCKNPHVQKKIVEELDEIFIDDKKRDATLHDLNNMKYLEAVIKETLRLYPSVPFFARELQEDATFKGTTYPKGLSIMFFCYYMQRRPDIFKDPTAFNPDRFLLEKNDGRLSNPFSYVPFSAGPRNCIGQKFAMYEIKSSLSKIIRNFELLPVDSKYDVILSSETILKSANGIPVRMKKRN